MNWQKANEGAFNALHFGVIESTQLGIAFAIIHGESVRHYALTYQSDKNLDCRNVQPSTWKRLKKEWNRPLLHSEWRRSR